MPHATSESMRRCVDHCLACHRACAETVTHCLEMGGPHAAPAHIGLLLDCAQICATSADFMLRGSPFHEGTCSVCAEICEACAADCERLADGDEAMRRCAEACRTCAQSCLEMAGMAA